MEQDIKNLQEIINLCNEELDNEDENVTAVLDLVDLKSLRNLIKAYKEQNDIIKTANIAIKDLQQKLENSIPVSLVEETILNPMKEEHDKAIKGFIKRDIPQCIEDGGIAQELGYFIGKIEEVLSNRVFLDNLGYAVLIKDIVKHSKQLIDLIENKDILKVRIDKTIMFFGIDESTSDTKYKEIIKSIENGKCELLEILTHQQFEANCYKVGGKQWD